MGFFSKKKEKDVVSDKATGNTALEKAIEPAKLEVVDPEVVAAITAAVYAMMGSSSNLVVRNIVRVNDNTPIWAKVSRRDVMSSRL